MIGFILFAYALPIALGAGIAALVVLIADHRRRTAEARFQATLSHLIARSVPLERMAIAQATWRGGL